MAAPSWTTCFNWRPPPRSDVCHTSVVGDPDALTIIGVIRSERTELADTPVQSGLNRGESATVTVFDAFVDGLDGLGAFDFVWLLTWLGGTGDAPAARPALRQVPFLLQRQPREIGIFATRGPRRVNPIGLSLVRVLAVDGGEVRFAGVDMVDGTPVIDIKPYVTAFDLPPGAPRCGWFDQVELVSGVTPAALRPDDRSPDK
jgi:tRNA-Thr(GGU) m(6)t(6)A37 methyltransferase TsaA